MELGVTCLPPALVRLRLLLWEEGGQPTGRYLAGLPRMPPSLLLQLPQQQLWGGGHGAALKGLWPIIISSRPPNMQLRLPITRTNSSSNTCRNDSSSSSYRLCQVFPA